jgi:hypothetical protein
VPSVEQHDSQSRFAPITTPKRDRQSSEEEHASRLLSLARTPDLSSASCSRASSVDSDVETPKTPQLQPRAKRQRTNKPRYQQPDPPYVCPGKCEVSFTDISAYRKHMQESHKDDFTICMREECVRTVSNEEEPNMTIVWHYKNDHSLEAFHCKEHPKCNYKATFDIEKYKKHVASHKLRCTRCFDEGKRALPFANQRTLDHHIKTTHMSLNYSCNVYDVDKGEKCNKTFETEHSRNQHQSRAHKGSFLCQHCTPTQMFDTEMALAKHVKGAHPAKYDIEWAIKARDKTYPCAVCKKDFSSASNRAKHIRSVHEKERKWQCNTTDISDSDRLIDDNELKLAWDYESKGCKQAYANKQTLIDHVRSEHFGLLRWEALKKLKSGETARRHAERKAKMIKNQPVDAVALLTGVATGLPEPRTEPESKDKIAEDNDPDATEDEYEDER